jgi:hypothetical protein
MRKIMAGLFAALGVMAACVSPAHADGGTTTATGTFTAANDTVKPYNDTNPRGYVTFSQPTGGGAITGRVHETGLGPNKAYVVVPYTDGACIPDPGGTAFPSSRFVTDNNGNADASVTVTPNAINPLGQLDLRNVHSISTREVLVNGIVTGPINGPNVPTPITETCDTAPVIR